MSASDDHAGRLPLRVILPFSTPTLPLSALGLVVFVQLPAYFARDLGVSLTVIGAAWFLVRMFDAPVDILIALGMDRSRTRFGRYRVWLIAGAPILIAGLWALFMAPPKFSGAYLFSWLLVMYLGLSIMSLAHPAWAATLATHYHERSRLFGIITAVGVVGTLGVMSLGIFGRPLHLSEAQSVRAMGWAIIALTPVTVLLAAAVTREHIEPEDPALRATLRDYAEVLLKPDTLRLFFSQVFTTLGPGWMAALYFFFFQDALGFSYPEASLLLAVYILAQIPGALAFSWIARRIGKHWALMLAASAFSLGLVMIFVLPKGNVLVALGPMAFEGIAAAGFGQMIQAMLADVADEIRLNQGKQRLSLLYAVNGLGSKIAAAIAIGVAYPLLDRLGYHPSGHNGPAAIANLQLVFLVGPMVFVMLGGLCVFGWRLDARRHDAVRAALEARDASLGSAEASSPARSPLRTADPEIAA
ncbi:MAG TPA: MFS transporter [Caulobacteraceae bacterium]|nr:MFS transporter [Caulobacteraceae bacterium]